MINKKRLQPGRDAIQRYLDEISETPLLSDAEEQELALRIQQGDRRAADNRPSMPTGRRAEECAPGPVRRF